MRIMNPYLVETFVKTTGSHQNVTDDFGNTDGPLSVTEDFALQSTETLSGLWEKQMIARKHNQQVKNGAAEVPNNWDSISNQIVKKKLEILASWLTIGGKDAHGGYIMWANKLHINLPEIGQKLNTWWSQMNQKSRIALWHNTQFIS